jgi:fructoselysine-6-P-deglycase FrlB-like protein
MPLTRIRQEECDEAIRQIHLLRDEMESVGDRAEELLAKLISMMGCGASTTDMVWIQKLVQEAMAAQQRLLAIIEVISVRLCALVLFVICVI